MHPGGELERCVARVVTAHLRRAGIDPREGLVMRMAAKVRSLRSVRVTIPPR
jgi:hypothetical protein